MPGKKRKDGLKATLRNPFVHISKAGVMSQKVFYPGYGWDIEETIFSDGKTAGIYARNAGLKTTRKRKLWEQTA